MPDTRERLSEALRNGRRLKGLSQGDLADRVGASLEAIGNIERGKSSPSVDLFVKIVQVLDLDPRVVIGETGAGDDLRSEKRRKLEERAFQMIRRLDEQALDALIRIGRIVGDLGHSE
jgi:transcriptional regulator with XRE-family HTH domain